jgi:glycosyltransferase involved in cell wall biosynthesis
MDDSAEHPVSGESSAEVRLQSSDVCISVLCPFYNEEAVVEQFFARLFPILEGLHRTYEVICVNDGSRDGTLAALLLKAKQYRQVKVIDLSRNFGKEAALSAALDYANGYAIVPIDADLQDPPELIPAMVEKWEAGAEVVLARRSNRNSDSQMKRTTAVWFYLILNRLADIGIPENVGDFRLMDRRVVNAVKTLPESRRFMKGIFAWVGFRTVTLDYIREERVAGTSKFNGWRLWNFALEGITSFSTVPLRAWLYIGLSIALISIIYGLIIITKTVIFGVQQPGYASLMVSVLFLGGIQLIGIGVLGEYIGRVYLESKRRPLYIVRDVF